MVSFWIKKILMKINDLIFDFPYSYTDRSKISELDKLEVGKLATIKVKVDKYSFPRIRNLPNKVLCSDETGDLDCIFFNSYEGYIKKILPLEKEVTISGKITQFKNKYQSYLLEQLIRKSWGLR